MPTRLVSIPFALGFDEETAPRELPMGPLREAVNVRQRRGSAFGMRPDFPLATMTAADGTLVARDLYNLNGRLFALGDSQGASDSPPSDLFEYVQQPGGEWRGSVPVGGIGSRVPPLVAVRNIGQPPDQTQDVKTSRVAAVNGIVCVAHGFGASGGGDTSYVHIFRASTDSTLVFQAIPASNPRVVVAGDSFWILGVNSTDDLVGYRFDTTAVDVLALQALVTLYTGTVTTNIYSACSVNAASIVEFAFIVRDGAGTVIRRFNEAGVQQTSFAGPAVTATVLQIEADSVANEIIVAYRAGIADANLQTYNLTTNASVVGPTAVYAQTVEGDLSLTRLQLGSGVAFLVSEDADLVLRSARFATATHVRTVFVAHNMILAGRGVGLESTSGDTLIGVAQPVISDSNNQMLLLTFTGSEKPFIQLASLDAGIAEDGDPAVAQAMGGDSARDATTGRYYWTRLVEATDGQRTAIPAEFQLGTAQRRQACQIGNVLFLAGAIPLSFDGRQIVESGFTERPVFVSSTPSASVAALIPGAEYDYVAVYKWSNAQNESALSALSEIQTVTMGATDTIVTHLIYAPHTLRSDVNTGSTATVLLYRTDVIQELTTAELFSSRDFISTPAADGDFNALTLQLSVDGGGTQTVTFDATDSTIAEIVAEINADTTGLTASAVGNTFKIVSDTEGSGGSLLIIGGTATAAGVGFIGLVAGQGDSGTTTNAKGTVFRLVGEATVPIANEYGQSVEIVDSTSDTTILTREPVYTQGERGALSGILPHEAPPACEFCATVGSRVFIGGLDDRSAVAISKALFPTESVAFSNSFAFTARVEGDVTAVGGLDGNPVAFTADAIFVFSRQLPDDNGDNGQLGPPQRLPSEGGCDNPHSILETSHGLFYQARDTKLMLLPRGGSAPIWAGKPIQDTLTAFPDITGAAYCDEDHTACFTARNAAGTASVIIVFDLRIGAWYLDTFASAQVMLACADYLGRLAYIDTNAVRLQSASLIPAAFIAYNAKTGSITAFGANGWGKLPSISVAGEFRGRCVVTLLISYDDGVTFTTLSAKTLNATTGGAGNNGFVAGESFTISWFPARRKGDTFVLDFRVTADAGNASAGVILNAYTLELDGPPQKGRVRLAIAERG